MECDIDSPIHAQTDDISTALDTSHICTDDVMHDMVDNRIDVQQNDTIFNAPVHVEMESTFRSNIRPLHINCRWLACESDGITTISANRTRVTAIDVFKRLLSDDVVNRIVQQSCSGHGHVMTGGDEPSDETLDESNMDGSMDPYVSCSDVFHFIGVTLLMGRVILSTERKYWEGTVEGDCDTVRVLTAIRDCMSGRKYARLRTALKFNDTSHTDSGRMDWLVDSVFANARQLYTPTSHTLTLDDQSIRCYARFKEVQGPRNKKADSCAIIFDSINHTNGFTLGMKMKRKLVTQSHTSQESPTLHSHDHDTDSEHGVTPMAHHILNFVDEVLPDGDGFELNMDSAYTSYQLLDELYMRGITATGTIRSNWLTHSSPELHISKKQRRQLGKCMC